MPAYLVQYTINDLTKVYRPELYPITESMIGSNETGAKKNIIRMFEGFAASDFTFLSIERFYKHGKK